MAHAWWHKDKDDKEPSITFDDVVDWWGHWESYKNGKSDEKAAAAWNAYNRQVDLFALEGLQGQLDRREATLANAITTATEKAALYREQQVTASERASLARESSRTRGENMRTQADLDYEESMAVLAQQVGRQQRDVGRRRRAVAIRQGTLGVRLSREERDAAVESGLLTPDEARGIEVYGGMRRAAELRGAHGKAVRGEMLTEWEQLNAEEYMVGRTAAVQRAEIREEAVFARGAAEAGEAARVGFGSFASTERARIDRLRRRRLEGVDLSTAAQQARIGGRRRQALGTHVDLSSQLQNLDEDLAELAWVREARTASVGQRRTSQQDAADTVIAEGAAQAAEHAATAAGLGLRARQEDRRIEQLDAEELDRQKAAEVVEWQLESLPALPEGSSRSGISLWFNIAAEVVD